VKPINDPQLQLPLYSPDGYSVQLSNGEYVLLVPGGDYQGLIFSEMDFTSITIGADFTGVTFSHCRFVMTDLSGSILSSAHFHDCHISQSALMWTQSSDIKFSDTLVEDTRFAFSNLSRAQFVSGTTLHDCNFRDTNLEYANFNEVVMTDCMFLNTIAPEIIIHDSCLARVGIKKSNFLGLKVSDSLVDTLHIDSSNLSGSSWCSVTTKYGYWSMWGVDFTASKFSLCDAKSSTWTWNTFFGVVMERCNWFENSVSVCSFEQATFSSVGWNSTKFYSTSFTNLKASGCRFRYADFLICTLQDSTISHSAFEYCQLSESLAQNLQIVEPTYSINTNWHDGYTPDTQQNSTDHPTNN